MSPSATPAMQSEGGCFQVPRLPDCQQLFTSPDPHVCAQMRLSTGLNLDKVVCECVIKLCVKESVIWCVARLCERWCVTKLCVKDSVCDKVVCDLWKKLCVKESVWQSCVWQSCVCERWCVTKLCVKESVWQSCVWKIVCVKEIRSRRGRDRERDTESKTRTPDKDVGNSIYISADPGLRQGRGGAWDHRRCGSCLSWTLATPNAAGKSHHKATAMAQEHPTAAAMASFISVQGCRLPGLKPSKPSNSSKSLPNSAGKRYPNKPNTRNARRQKPPQGHSNGSRAPHGRSNGFL